jgi:MFS family permease
VADLSPETSRGTAFGWYYAANGVGMLGASVCFGVVWHRFGSGAAFGLGSVLALAATAMLPWVVRR